MLTHEQLKPYKQFYSIASKTVHWYGLTNGKWMIQFEVPEHIIEMRNQHENKIFIAFKTENENRQSTTSGNP